MEQLHAMVIHNNTVELAGSVFWYVLLSLSRTPSLSGSALRLQLGRARAGAWQRAQKHSSSHSPPVPWETPGECLLSENRPGERKQSKRRGRGEARRQEAAERGEERRGWEGSQRLSGTFLIMFQQDKSHPVAIWLWDSSTLKYMSELLCGTVSLCWFCILRSIFLSMLSQGLHHFPFIVFLCMFFANYFCLCCAILMFFFLSKCSA